MRLPLRIRPALFLAALAVAPAALAATGRTIPGGYQSAPVDPGITSPRKMAFVAWLKVITGRL